jgi:HEXXH motif-containing protein
MMTDAAAVLRWTEQTVGSGRAVELEFEMLLRAALRRLWQEAASGQEADQPFADDGTPDAAYRRVLLAPSTVRHLLWPSRGRQAEVRDHWRAACQIERAILGLPNTAVTGWSADGRAFVAADGRCTVQPSLEGTIPLDLHSPQALALDLLGGDAPMDPPRSPPSASAVQRTSRRLLEAWHGISASEPAVPRCVEAWTRVIVAQGDPSGRFWSGSNGQYVGRVMIVNADAPNTDTEEIADAIVHEAIHGFLYMHESIEPWVLGKKLYTNAGVIASPWSGTELPVRPFMQAAFVWYGLAMFWAQHIDGGPFDRERARAMLERSLAGFRRGSLVDRLKPWQAKIRSEMTDAINGLQRDVLSLLAA